MEGSVDTSSGMPVTHKVWIRRSSHNLFGSAYESLHLRRPDPSTVPTKKEVVQEVRDTVAHEIGHHFGFDDDEMPY